MNMETQLDFRLWSAIRTSFESRNYTGAILDAIYFLSELIREKAGLESDGVSLIGQAFGGKVPRLKVNKLQSESDWNVQKGIEQMLRGLYQAIRNPRSHEKYTDSEQDAAAIILFVDYLVKVIDLSKTPFSKSTFLRRVLLDPDFVEMDRYAQLLVDEIPAKLRLEVGLDVYNNKLDGNGNKLFYFFKALLAVLDEDEKRQLYAAMSEDLKYTDDVDVMRTVLQAFPHEAWLQFDEVARLRVENKLIKSMKDGRYSESEDHCYGGAFGARASNIFPEFMLNQQVLRVTCDKLNSSDTLEQDYAFRYLFPYMDVLFEKPDLRLKYIVNKYLKDGNKRFYDAVDTNFLWLEGVWSEPFKQAMENFKESELELPSPEELPF